MAESAAVKSLAGKAKAKATSKLAGAYLQKNVQAVIAFPLYEFIVTGPGMKEAARHKKLGELYHACGDKIDYVKECLAGQGAFARLWEKISPSSGEMLIICRHLNDNQVGRLSQSNRCSGKVRKEGGHWWKVKLSTGGSA